MDERADLVAGEPPATTANDVASAMLHVLAESDPVNERLADLHVELREIGGAVWMPEPERARREQEIENEIAELEQASDESQHELQRLHGQFQTLQRRERTTPLPVSNRAPVVCERPRASRPRERRFRRRARAPSSSSSADDSGSEPDLPRLARLGRASRRALKRAGRDRHLSTTAPARAQQEVRT